MHIAIEWTSATFHAWLLERDGRIAAEHRSTRGVNTVTGGDFAGVLRSEVGGWLDRAQAILLSGMATSRTGWVESPFVMVPASHADLLSQAVTKEIEGFPPLYFLPGIARHDPVPDVMRGEEMAIFGIEGPLPALIVLPGAHSKWVRTDGKRILDISTYMSGEILHLLRKDSLVSRLIPENSGSRPDAFERGVRISRDKEALPGGVLQRVFSARSLVLFGQLEPEDISDYLAGLIIGSEIEEALAGLASPPEVHVLGTNAPAKSYRHALALLGIDSPEIAGDAARGFSRLIADM